MQAGLPGCVKATGELESMLNLSSYIVGQWVEGQSDSRQILDASLGEPVARYSEERTRSYSDAVAHAHKSGAALRSHTLYERAYMVKALAQTLNKNLEHYYQISATTGATRKDSWIDIEGGIGTLFSLSSLVRKEMIDGYNIPEGSVALLSRGGSFIGRHVLSPQRGVSVQINAYNFPCWGMLEKLAASVIAGVPAIVKPASQTAHLAWAVFTDIVNSGILPEGSVQFICGPVNDLLTRLGPQDSVAFTGSARTAGIIKRIDNLIDANVRVNCETDSLNCIVLDESVSKDDEDFTVFIKEVAREMTAKAGQKCTAVRRVIVPATMRDAVVESLRQRLESVAVGSAHSPDTRMGPLAGLAQRQSMIECLEKLGGEGEFVCGGDLSRLRLHDGDASQGAYFPATLLLVDDAAASNAVHEIEAFGPVSSLLCYDGQEQRDDLISRGRGSLVCTFCSRDSGRIRAFVDNQGCWHGRIQILNSKCARESTGHGSPMPHLVHGGPGRAGGGEELGGARAILHFMQRTAIQGHPDDLTAACGEFHPGAIAMSCARHPMSMNFEDLQVSMSFTSHGRTITEADVVNFGCLSGDHFYAHFDEQAARESIFGQRVAHGYLLISVAAGLFVYPGKGPLQANYGMNDLRFVRPVHFGETIHVRVVVKSKHSRSPRPDENPRCGVVTWAATVYNQDDQECAVYDVLTLVAFADATLSALESATLAPPEPARQVAN